MWCYVGKATKIFFVVVAVLAVVGLIVGFGFLRHGPRSRAQDGGGGGGGCDGDGCQPAFPVPIPATPTTSASPLLSPPAIPESAAPPPEPPHE
ncbi:uncharacterized protein Os04g0629400 [Phoenix dactylifera]|uniref:Uncharacterized protein Os04g0629400 n=1 Tax=Phoenix dactylifera TaxID=42345 RepID=A0A8B7BGC4_PHODC|nr:uncharacterized protein Os04g0629400 [Phoenix dactylifera]